MPLQATAPPLPKTHVAARSAGPVLARHGRLLDNVVALILRHVLVWSLSIISVLIVPRYLGDEGLGHITFATGLIMVGLALTSLGTEPYVVKQIAADQTRAGPLLALSYATRLFTSVVVALALVIALQVWRVDAELRAVLYAGAAMLVVMSISRAQSAAIQGLQRMRWFSLSEVLNKVMVTVAGAALLLAGFGVTTYALVMLAGALVALGTGSLFIARQRFELGRLRSIDLRPFLAGALPFFMLGLIGQAYQWLDVTMLMLFTSSAVVGWYGAALQLYSTANFLPFVLSTALLPALTQIRDDRDELLRVARGGLAGVVLTSVPMAVGLAVLSGRLIDFLGYPGSFDNSAPLLAILAFTLPLTGALMVMSTVVAAVDRQAEWAKLIAVSLAIDVALSAVLIPIFANTHANGGIGAAIAAVSVEALQILLAMRLLPTGLINSALIRTAIKTLLASGAMAVAVLLSAGTFEGLVPLALIGALTYCAALVLTRGIGLREAGRAAGAWLRRDAQADAPTATSSSHAR
jgi:O-antigen/teichoic acid export membrane protein